MHTKGVSENQGSAPEVGQSTLIANNDGFTQRT